MKAQWLNTEWVSRFQTSHFTSGSRARYFNYSTGHHWLDWSQLLNTFAFICNFFLLFSFFLNYRQIHTSLVNTFFTSKYDSRFLKGEKETIWQDCFKRKETSLAHQNNMQYFKGITSPCSSKQQSLITWSLVSFTFTSLQIPENWSQSNNAWSPSCGQRGLHSHVNQVIK